MISFLFYPYFPQDVDELISTQNIKLIATFDANCLQFFIQIVENKN